MNCNIDNHIDNKHGKRFPDEKTHIERTHIEMTHAKTHIEKTHVDGTQLTEHN